jgi:hypothetical protein
LRRAFRPWGYDPLCHHARFEISADEARYSRVANLLREFLHQEIVIDAVEEFLQVHVDHDPAAFGYPLPVSFDRLRTGWPALCLRLPPDFQSPRTPLPFS